MAEMTVDQAVLAIRELQSQRVGAVKAMTRLNNQRLSLARRVLGWRWDMEKKESDRISKLAAKLVKAILAHEPPPDGTEAQAAAIAEFVFTLSLAQGPLDKFRTSLEKRMRKLSASLPVWQKVKSIKGFGSLGLSIVVGEAGDLGGYGNPAKLWKRMGVMAGQHKSTDKEEAARLGYNPRRRSALWTIGDSLLKTNDDGYKSLYDTEKARQKELHPELTKMHAHRRAQRYVEKRLLLALWRAWREIALPAGIFDPPKPRPGETQSEARSDDPPACSCEPPFILREAKP